MLFGNISNIPSFVTMYLPFTGSFLSSRQLDPPDIDGCKPREGTSGGITGST